MAVVKVKPSIVVDHQAPEFIRSDYAKLITFLQKYYEYLEQNNKPLDVIRYLDVYNDVDEQTEDNILGVLYSLFLPDFPQILTADKSFLLKHVVEFYKSKGSIESIEAFFRIIYGEQVDVYLPKVDILKVSAGIWKKLFKIKITGISSGTIYQLLGQEIYQIDPVNGNKTVKARIVDYDEVTGSVIITADNIVLNFDTTRTVYSTRNDTGADVTFTVINQLAAESISYGGLNYKAGDRAVLDDTVSNTENIEVDSVSYGKIKQLILQSNADNYSILDEISFDDNYEFDGSNGSVVSTANNTIDIDSHSLVTGDIVRYRVEPDTTYTQTAIGGLTDGSNYYVIKVDTALIKLATTLENAKNNIAIDLTSVGAGVKHYIVYELPDVVKAKAKITRTASEDLYSDVTDSLSDYYTFSEEEDRILLENGFTIREEFGEANVFKSVSKTKYVTDENEAGVNSGSLSSAEFSLLLEVQENDSLVYNSSSYVKSNGLIRQLLPAYGDQSGNYALDWASNKGINVTLIDEELRVGFAYDSSYAVSGSVTPTDPVTFIIEFQSNEDYNNLDFYELTRNWGTTVVPQVKAITSWDYYSAAEIEDFSYFSELQHLGIYPESARTFSNGMAPISQRGFDPVNKPILVIREIRTQTDSTVTGTQRPWEYRFVFRQGKKANVRVFVNPQPIRIANQLLTCETTTGNQTLFTESGDFIIQENYDTVVKAAINQPGSTSAALTFFNSLTGAFFPGGSSDLIKMWDTVKITARDETSPNVLCKTPITTSSAYSTNRIVNSVIGTKAANNTDMIAILHDESNALQVSNSKIAIGSAASSTITGASSTVPWAGMATNGSGRFLVVQKSQNTIFGATSRYTSTNESYYADFSTPISTPAWTNVKLPETRVWGNVEYGNGKFVVVEGTGKPLIEPVDEFLTGSRVLYSTDAENWSVSNLPHADCWTKVKFVNGQFWALPYGTTQTIATNSISDEGIEGQTITVSAPAGTVFSRVLFASYGTPTGTPGSYVINPAQHSANSIDVVGSIVLGKNSATISVNNQTFGNDPAPSVLKRLYVTLEYRLEQTVFAAVSADAITWNQIRMPFDKVADIDYGNGVYVLTSYNNTSDYAYSTDGIKWKRGRLPLNDQELNNFQTTGNAFWANVTFCGDKFVALPANDPSNNTNSRLQDRVAVSADGINWELDSSSGSTTQLQADAGSKGYWSHAVTSQASVVSIAAPVTTFIAQGVTFTPSTSALSFTDFGRGFAMGGLNPGNLNEIDGIDFASETAVNPAAGLAVSRYVPCGMHSNTIGYAYAGWVSGGSGTNEIDGIRFSDQTLYNPVAVASTAGGHTQQGAMYQRERGYQMGGYNASPQNIGYVQRFQFDTEVATNLTALTLLPATSRHGPMVVASPTKAYAMGGYDYAPNFSSEIDGIDMVSETLINPAATLSLARYFGSSASSSTRGYALGGNSSPITYTTEIDGIQFDTEAFINPAATLTTASYGAASTERSNGTAGYDMGGYNGGSLNKIGKFTYSTETHANLGITLATARYYQTGVSQASVTTSYTWRDYYNRSIQGSATGGGIYFSPQQLTKNKNYYITNVGGGNTVLLRETKYSLPVTCANPNAGSALATLMIDRVSTGSADSFTKSDRDAQITVYAKKRTVGARDYGLRYNRNPLVPTYDDIEKENVNYTSDNKLYLKESINEYTDFILAERSELFLTDQVNLELEIDKRSPTESENYVTYPYFALETSAVSVVERNDDILIPDYSKVRVFVDKSVLQSTNSINRQAGLKTFNDYGVFGPSTELTITNSEKQSYSGLSNPLISSTATTTTYRNNFNYLIEGYDETPYVNAVIPDQREYTSGPGEFGNTGVVSFVNNRQVRVNSQAVSLENAFYNVAISAEQNYYDNDSRKLSKNRNYYTVTFNTPKEIGDKFDKPFDISLRNIIDGTRKNNSFLNVDYGDKILLDSGTKVDGSIVNFKRFPLSDWTPIMSGNVSYVENWANKLQVSTANFVGQSWPAYRDPIINNIQNGTKILLAPGLTSWNEYQNLPDYLRGLSGTNSINDGDSTAMWFSHPVRVYLIRDPGFSPTSTAGFTLVETGKNYITGYTNLEVYRRDFDAGGPYTLDNLSAMYLFEPRNIGPNRSYGFAKTSGTTAWDSQIYSTRGFFRNVYVKAQVSRNTGNPELMFGLNSDPTANASYDTLDFSWYFDGGTARIYENGSFIGNFGTYTAQTVFEIIYDGVNVYYLRDNQIERVVPRGVGAMLYFDSSFYQNYSFPGPFTSFQNLEYGEIARDDIIVPSFFNRPEPEQFAADTLMLEDGSAEIAAEINKFGLDDVGGNYSKSEPTLAIEFFSPRLAAEVSTSGLSTNDAVRNRYHYILYCDKAEYLNVSTDTQKTVYTFYNCWSPSGSHFIPPLSDSITDYIVSIRDLTKTDYIIKRKYDALNKQSASANESLYRDVYIRKGEDNYGKYVKFYNTSANAVADTSAVSLSTLGIGSSTLSNVSEETADSVITLSSKTAHSYYGTITDNDALITYVYDPFSSPSGGEIILPNHGLTTGDQVKFRTSFEGIKSASLVDGKIYFVRVINTSIIALHLTLATALSATVDVLVTSAGVASGKKNYLQLLPKALDFGSTQLTVNTKTRYSVAGNTLIPYAAAEGRIINADGGKTISIEGRTDVLQLTKTVNVFNNVIEFNTGDYVEIALGAGDSIKDHDGNVISGPTSVFAYAVRHNDYMVAFVKKYEEAIKGESFLTGYYNNFDSVFTNTTFRTTDSYVASNTFFLPLSQKHNFTAGTKLNIISSGIGLNNATTYFVSSSNLTDGGFSITTNNTGSGVTAVSPTAYNNLIRISVDDSDSKIMRAPMITGTVKEDISIVYSPIQGRETGTIENFELQISGSYNRIPVPKIIPLDGRLGAGAEMYPIVQGIGAVKGVDFIDGGTHSVNRTLYLPFSFFSSTITGNWQIGEVVLNGITPIGTLTDKNGRYFKIEQNGSLASITYGDTLTGQESGATAVVGKTVNISAVTNARPALITTSTDHYLNNGDTIYITGINTVVPTGTYYVSVTGAKTFYLFSNVGLSTPVDTRATAAYTSGGTVSTGLYTATGTALPGEVTLSSANGPTTNYENDKNLLLTTSKLQDSYYYQDYSYAVRSGTSFDNWKPYFNKLVHPAGVAVFGEINYNTPNGGTVLLGNTEVVNNQINNTKTATSTTVTIT